MIDELMFAVKLEAPIICYFCGEPIIKMSGHESESFLEHHLSYDPEIKVPVHHGCNTRFHKTHPMFPKNPENENKKRFIKNLGNNFICYFCGKKIITKGTLGNALVIHSLDNNHKNWDRKNKVPCHRICHIKYHKNNLSYETRQRISRGNKGKKRSEENRKKYSIAKKGEVSIEANKKGWKTRREVYGPSGFKLNGMKRPEVAAKVSKTLSGRIHGSERNKKAWKKRRELYGLTGGKFLENWEQRRIKYGPTGHGEKKVIK